MIHEGLSLEYAGWQLAVVQAAAYVRQLSFLLLAALLLPGDALWALAAWVVGLAVAVTVVETAVREDAAVRDSAVARERVRACGSSVALRLLGTSALMVDATLLLAGALLLLTTRTTQC